MGPIATTDPRQLRPVLTLWATVVAEQLGRLPETALTLSRFVAGSSARAKARRLGIIAIRISGWGKECRIHLCHCRHEQGAVQEQVTGLAACLGD